MSDWGKIGHYAIGLRDGGSEWHIGTTDRHQCRHDSCLDEEAERVEIAQLRKIEEAAQILNMVLSHYEREWQTSGTGWRPVCQAKSALRAALAPEAKAVCGGMPWPARCRYCDLVTEDPDAFFWPPGADEETLPDSYRCAASPSGLHQVALARAFDLEGARLIGKAAIAGETDDA